MDAKQKFVRAAADFFKEHGQLGYSYDDKNWIDIGDGVIVTFDELSGLAQDAIDLAMDESLPCK